MNIVEVIEMVKNSIGNIDMKASKQNCDSVTAAYFWLDKIAEACNNVIKQKGGEPVDGESEKQNV